MATAGHSTIGTQIAASGGRSSGFEYMRLALAVSIVIFHTAGTSYGPAMDEAVFDGPARPFVRMVLPMFFALSGFLVAGSMERSKTLGMFLSLRALRIYPALIVEVLLSAFILGPIVTTHALSEYFFDPLFLRYLLNMLGDVHFQLPGVFETNPLPNVVNGQLWTIPFELYCYATFAILGLIGVRKRRWLAPLSVIGITLLYLAAALYRHHGQLPHVSGAVNGALLVATFMAGVSFYLYRDAVRLNARWGIAALVVSGVLISVIHGGDFLLPFVSAYATIYLGLLNPSHKLLPKGDYSYGIYLYGFSIQQSVVYLVPSAHHWYVNGLISTPIVILVAMGSWHFIEAPVQKLRPYLKKAEEWYLGRARQQSVKTPASSADVL